MMVYVGLILTMMCQMVWHFDEDCRTLHSGEKGFVQLADDEEPGERLLIYGKVLNKMGTAIPNAHLFLYQADETGEYRSTMLGMPSYARIRGELRTNDEGCFVIETIIPGNYPRQETGKHIHVEASAEGYARRKFEFLFEGWLTSAHRGAVKGNSSGIILDPGMDNEVWTVETLVELDVK